ncbi:MAG: hypothetical protein AAF411_11045 [Myxococcota bacterium]
MGLRTFTLAAASALCFSSFALPASVRAQDVAEAAPATRLRPTSDELSIIGGRTMASGESALAGGLGWPGFWIEYQLAPSSRFNLGFRAHVDYAAQLGTGAGFGGGLSVPLRFLIFAKDRFDVALWVTPFFGLGEGAYVGQEGVFSDDFGWTAHVTAGLRLSFQASRLFTFTGGAEGSGGILVNSAADDVDPIATFAAIAGAEIRMSASTILFALLRVGGGIRPDELFDGALFLRGSIGFAYRL